MTISRRAAIIAPSVMMIGSVRAQERTSLIILVELSEDRDQTGKLYLKKGNLGATIAGPFTVYGRADNQTAKKHGNDSRDPTKLYGDTPTGSYTIPRSIATGGGALKPRSYGSNGALVLKPASGQAKTAEANGRTGLLIHGGDLGKGGRLRATHGCLRLSNDDVAALFVAISAAGQNAQFQRCEIVRLKVTIGAPGDFESAEDVGDPPPGIANLLTPGPLLHQR